MNEEQGDKLLEILEKINNNLESINKNQIDFKTNTKFNTMILERSILKLKKEIENKQ
jgi:hypothetical protein